MYILGINAYHADSSAAIFKDGKMIVAIEEERFRRVKHWAGFPSLAVKFCLEEANISMKDVDHVAIGRDPWAKFWKKITFLVTHPLRGFSAVFDRIGNAKKVSSIERELHAIDKSVSVQALKKKIKQVEHHRSHLASAFFASPFEEAAILSIDGSGDFTTTMIAIGRGNKIQVLDSVDLPNSVGFFYTAFTQLLGFPHYGDEYKVMGLAPYGQPLHLEALRDVIHLESNGLFSLNKKYFRPITSGIVSYGEDNLPVVAPLYTDYMISKFGKVRMKEEPLSQYHKDLAASVQRFTEEVIFYILSKLHERTGLDNVCIAGGVAQNSVANGKLLRNTPFKNVYIPSAGHDAGISMGSALFCHNDILGLQRSEPIWSAYTGSKYSNEEIKKYLDGRSIAYSFCTDEELYDKVSECIVQGGVVGWFSGRSEFGPRALGARSILADPRRPDAKELLNSKIKKRESFRPFAPSILEEYVSEYFEVNDRVPFMEKVFPIKADKHSVIPAVTHVDGSGRLQSVNQAISPRYYALIERFRQKTGVPILLNTSFNENEPIVNAPAEALDCYLRTQMDMLVLENFIIQR